jgi:preprotein translocase subunit SecD
MPPALENPFVLWLLLSAAVGALAWFTLRPELRQRAILYAAFLIACGVAVWPPYEVGDQPGKIRLGLDLRGGMFLVLQVKTDDALVATTDDAVQSVRDQASRRGIVVGSVQRKSTSALSLQGVEPARVKDARDMLREMLVGWDVREVKEGELEAQMSDTFVRNLREQTVLEAQRTLERRVNALGVAEPVITRTGSSGDQIQVQLPGVTDREQAKRMIRTTAQLALKIVEDSAPSQEALLQAFGGKAPDNMEVVSGSGDRPGESAFYLVRREAVITGRDLKTARASVDENNQPDIAFSLTPQGATKFARETGRNIGRRLAIILDGSVYSSPVIQSQIRNEGRITGRFSTQEADELSKILKAGALPATLVYQQELSVGASLGKDSIRSGTLAALGASAFIAIFMLLYYRLSGVNAIVALAANLLILLGGMAYFGATLTLPGIAGVILTVGVGVDTNVLVFERIREELRAGKTPKAAIANGFDRVWVTILDTHATALIAAAFLFQFGTGPIKGFAVTLFLGLVANVFASYFVSKFLFEWVLGGRPVQSLSI